MLAGFVGGSDVGAVLQVKRPEEKHLVVSAIDYGIAPVIRPVTGVLVLAARQRPELPAAQPLAMTQVKKRQQIIVGHHVFLASADVRRKERELDFVTKEPFTDGSVDREESGVIFLRHLRPLLKVKREESEPVDIGLGLGLAAGEAQELNHLDAIFAPVAVVGDPFPEEVEPLVVHIVVDGVGEERGNRP